MVVLSLLHVEFAIEIFLFCGRHFFLHTTLSLIFFLAGNNSVLGTNVDYAATWLAMAGIPTPPTMDGRSILTQLVPEENEDQLPETTRRQIQVDRASLATKPWRTEQFHQYYNSGGPSPYFPRKPLPFKLEFTLTFNRHGIGHRYCHCHWHWHWHWHWNRDSN